MVNSSTALRLRSHARLQTRLAALGMTDSANVLAAEAALRNELDLIEQHDIAPLFAVLCDYGDALAEHNIPVQAIGTAGGLVLGLGQISLSAPVQRISWALTQFFRNSPWLVLLFFVMLLTPFQVDVLGVRIPLPAWLKATFGLALPIMANISEIVRGSINSIPTSQWESAESLAFTRMQTLWRIILPQCVKRMTPPWMNWYAILTMATPLISIVGVNDSMTLVQDALAAEQRTELLMPMYGLLLVFFFLYCYPIAHWTMHLERKYAVKG